MAKPKDISTLTYDQALEELEGIVAQLEAEVGDLDTALALYERGQALSQHCSALLEQAELRVQQLGADGELKPLE